MDIKQQLQLWNKNKWESKNRAMYERFDDNQWPWFNESLDPDIEEYLAAAGIESADILDLGTCSGSQAIELAKRGHRVVGSDISESALAKAEAALAQEGDLPVEFLIDDITETVFEDNQFDVVLDRGCYHSICCFQHDSYSKAIRRVLKPDGLLLLKTMSSEEERFISYDRLGNKKIPMPFHFTRELLDEGLSTYFEVLEIRDSHFFSTVIDPPAKARFAILRNTA